MGANLKIKLMKHPYLFLIGLFLSVSSFGQTGKVFDNLSVKSEILNGDRKYAVYLPPDYETSERSYPVLYLLHGAGDDQTGWFILPCVKKRSPRHINTA